MFTEIPRYIVVEGPIGVGKTTLVGALARRLSARTVFEVFEENPFLADFYKDRERFAFQTEMFFLLSRYRQQEHFAQEDLFARHAVSDYLFHKSRLFAGLTLKSHEMDLFDNVYRIISRQVPAPDLVVYLHAPLEVLLRRIAARGREYEKDFDAGYLEQLCSLYATHFSRYKDTPLVSIDTTGIDFRDPEPVENLLHVMAAGRRGAIRTEEFRLTNPPFDKVYGSQDAST